jgi:hypothetical protein
MPEGSILSSRPCADRGNNGGKRGRGERIRTSGPCLPKAMPLGASVVFWRLSFGARCRPLPCGHVPRPRLGSPRTFGPCAYPCGRNAGGMAGVEGLAQASLFNAKRCLTIPKTPVPPLGGRDPLSNLLEERNDDARSN